MLETTCHCGAIRVSVSEKPEKLTQCTCSVCRRYGAFWGYFTRSTASAEFAPGAATAYLCNDRVIEFYHCNTCGCLTHYEGTEKTPDERLAVNFRMFAPRDYEGARIRTLDGADTWKFLD